MYRKVLQTNWKVLKSMGKHKNIDKVLKSIDKYWKVFKIGVDGTRLSKRTVIMHHRQCGKQDKTRHEPCQSCRPHQSPESYNHQISEINPWATSQTEAPCQPHKGPHKGQGPTQRSPHKAPTQRVRGFRLTYIIVLVL